MGYNEGSEVEDGLINRVLSFLFGSDDMGEFKQEIGNKEKDFWKKVIDKSGFTKEEIEEELQTLKKAKGGTIPDFKNGGFISWIKKQLGISEEEEEALKKPQWMTDHWETDKKAYNTEYAFGEHSPKLGGGTGNISNLTLEKLLEHQRQTVNNINRKKRLSKVKTPDMINGIPIPKRKPLNIIPSSAMGAYQLLSKTVEGLVKNLKLDPSKVIFTPEIQDKLALSLLKGIGVDTYLSNPKKVNLDTVQNNLAKEWASLPTSDDKSAHNQSLAMKSDPFRKQLESIQQEVEQGNITLLHGKYKILAIIRKAETALR